MTILQFMSESHFLTFFLACIIGGVISNIFKSITNSNRCPDCQRKYKEKLI